MLLKSCLSALAIVAVGQPVAVLAKKDKPAADVPAAPVSILPPSMVAPPPQTVSPPVIQPTTPTVQPVPPLPAQPLPPPPVLLKWTSGQAQALLYAIDTIGTRGLNPLDYSPDALRAAILAGEGEALDRAAKTAFDLLLSDLRDGRTPKGARIQWLIEDTDAVELPLDALLQRFLATNDLETVLKSVEPVHPEYAALKARLATLPASKLAERNQVRANLDRWRWMPRKLADKHVFANVPEYVIRVVTYGKTIANYRSIVGKLSSQTPSLLVPAIGIVVHPPWVIPRSLIKEEVGPLIARSPAAARARGYTWTGSGANLSVVQQPGPNAALGLMKIDMPNSEAIFIHDTPSRHLFNNATPRAYSHGCVRADRALELGILLGILQSGQEAEDLAAIIKLGKTEKVPFKESIPVAITYFTYGTSIDGKLQAFGDIYGRDAAVIAALDTVRMPPVTPVAPAVHIAPPTTEAQRVL